MISEERLRLMRLSMYDNSDFTYATYDIVEEILDEIDRLRSFKREIVEAASTWQETWLERIEAVDEVIRKWEGK